MLHPNKHDLHWNNFIQILEIEILMIASLVIQALLTFLAPLRKRNASGILMLCLWLLYLSASSVALFTIGLIIRNIYLRQYFSYFVYHIHSSRKMHVLWASFLLLHLGSPDSITSLSLEDNELWLRQTAQLITQASITFYVFGLYIYEGNHPDQRLFFHMVAFMYTNGCVRCLERISALYFASKEGIRASEWEAPPMTTSRRKEKNSDEIGIEIEVHGEFEIVNHAYFLYEKFRRHLADDVLTLNVELDSRSRVLFLHRPVNIGLRIIEAELNIIYDTFHSKVFSLYKKRAFLRIASFTLVLVATGLFFVMVFKSAIANSITGYDIHIGITIALFAGAILLDIASFVRFLFSDWCIIMVVKLLDDKPSKVLQSFLLVMQKWLRSRDNSAKRWCELCSSYNLLDCSLKYTFPTKLPTMIFMKRFRDCLISWLCVKRQPIKHSCLKFIFEELQQKVKVSIGNKEAAKHVCSARGQLVFEENTHYVTISKYLQPWTVDIHYSQSLLTWHLATDICYWADCSTPGDYKSYEVDYRSLGKQLSDYMTYILLRQPELVLQLVGKSDEQLETIKSDIVRVYAALSPSQGKIREFSTYILLQKSSQSSESSPSIFHESCCLAQQLFVLDKESKWEIISKVWVEMLCYAAIRSLPRYNYAQLSKGGELITLVWLYMTQLGFLPQNLSD